MLLPGLGCTCIIEWVDRQHGVKIKDRNKGMMATALAKYGGTNRCSVISLWNEMKFVTLSFSVCWLF